MTVKIKSFLLILSLLCLICSVTSSKNIPSKNDQKVDKAKSSKFVDFLKTPFVPIAYSLSILAGLATFLDAVESNPRALQLVERVFQPRLHAYKHPFHTPPTGLNAQWPSNMHRSLHGNIERFDTNHVVNLGGPFPPPPPASPVMCPLQASSHIPAFSPQNKMKEQYHIFHYHIPIPRTDKYGQNIYENPRNTVYETFDDPDYLEMTDPRGNSEIAASKKVVSTAIYPDKKGSTTQSTPIGFSPQLTPEKRESRA